MKRLTKKSEVPKCSQGNANHEGVLGCMHCGNDPDITCCKACCPNQKPAPAPAKAADNEYEVIRTGAGERLYLRFITASPPRLEFTRRKFIDGSNTYAGWTPPEELLKWLAEKMPAPAPPCEAVYYPPGGSPRRCTRKDQHRSFPGSRECVFSDPAPAAPFSKGSWGCHPTCPGHDSPTGRCAEGPPAPSTPCVDNCPYCGTAIRLKNGVWSCPNMSCSHGGLPVRAKEPVPAPAECPNPVDCPHYPDCESKDAEVRRMAEEQGVEPYDGKDDHEPPTEEEWQRYAKATGIDKPKGECPKDCPCWRLVKALFGNNAQWAECPWAEVRALKVTLSAMQYQDKESARLIVELSTRADALEKELAAAKEREIAHIARMVEAGCQLDVTDKTATILNTRADSLEKELATRPLRAELEQVVRQRDGARNRAETLEKELAAAKNRVEKAIDKVNDTCKALGQTYGFLKPIKLAKEVLSRAEAAEARAETLRTALDVQRKLREAAEAEVSRLRSKMPKLKTHPASSPPQTKKKVRVVTGRPAHMEDDAEFKDAVRWVTARDKKPRGDARCPKCNGVLGYHNRGCSTKKRRNRK